MGIFKGLILLTAIMLAAGLSNGYAQNSSEFPYIDSKHLYRIPMDNINNTVEWVLTNNTTGVSYTLVDEMTNGGVVWVDTSLVNTASVDSAGVEIKFLDALFNSGQNLTLIFSEWDGTGGTGNCIARRSMNIAITANTFYVSVSGASSGCNPLDGDVLNWNDVDLEPQVVGIPFTIKVNKTNFEINEWSFTGTVSGLSGDYVISGITSTGGTNGGSSLKSNLFAVSYTSGNSFFTVNVTETIDSGDSGDEIEILIQVSGRVWVGTGVTLTISGGQATSGNLYSVVTDDNGAGTKVHTYTVLPLPATPNIVMNE